MRTWSADNPKAALMARKRDALVSAALAAFLEEGYAGSSVNRIAATAGVSIKTLYRHFESKEELFTAVIQNACTAVEQPERPSWFALPPQQGLTEAGTEHLTNLLSGTELALYRVIVRESVVFPQLGQHYQEHVVGSRIATFAAYLETWPQSLRARISDPVRAGRLFGALLESEHLKQVLCGGPLPDAQQIRAHADRTATDFLLLIEADRL